MHIGSISSQACGQMVSDFLWLSTTNILPASWQNLQTLPCLGACKHQRTRLKARYCIMFMFIIQVQYLFVFSHQNTPTEMDLYGQQTVER